MAKKPSTTSRRKKTDSIVAHYLKRIAEKTKGVSSVYRGEANASWSPLMNIMNSAERRVWDSLEEKEKRALSANKKYLLSVGNMVDYHKNLLKEAELKGFRRMDGRDLSELESLAELRHFGAATCLLDFTDSALVALYFACRSEKENNGKIFILHHQGIPAPSLTDEISDLLEKGEVKLWRPIMQGQAERRIIRQSGLFLINLTKDKKLIKKNKNLHSIPIKFGHKKEILEELDLQYQISADTLFIDLSGFAENQASTKNVNEYWIHFYKGNAKANLRQYEEAIIDYNEAIRLRPDFAEAYNNRGNAKSELGQYEEAISDFDEAIRLRPDDAEMYYNRGLVKDELGQYEEAISDYNEAIRLAPGYAEAYGNRGIVWNLLGDKKRALADLEISKSLAEEQNNLSALKVAEHNIDEIEESLKSSEET